MVECSIHIFTTSMKRKPEQDDIAFYQKKIDAFNFITFNNSMIINIDAEQSYEDELLCIKKNIWDLLV